MRRLRAAKNYNYGGQTCNYIQLKKQPTGKIIILFNNFSFYFLVEINNISLFLVRILGQFNFFFLLMLLVILSKINDLNTHLRFKPQQSNQKTQLIHLAIRPKGERYISIL